MLRFLHLSDLHIGQARHTEGEVKYEAAHSDLLDDCEKWLSKRSDSRVDALIITGDIAFAGTKEDYQAAGALIEEVRAKVRAKHVLAVPGNHDVNWSNLNLWEYLEHDRVRKSNNIGTAITAFLKTPNARYDPLDKLRDYNEFITANQPAYRGAIESVENPAWEYDFHIQDGWTLRVHGFCSVLISNNQDADGNLVLGERQYYSKSARDSKVDHLVLIHHPLKCFADREDIKDCLISNVHIYLCGHAHMPEQNEENGVMFIQAGALYPPPNEKVSFSYNWIEISPSGDTHRPLKVEYFPRKWTRSKIKEKFSPDDTGKNFDSDTGSVVESLSSNFKKNRYSPINSSKAAHSTPAKGQDELVTEQDIALAKIRAGLHKRLRLLAGDKGSDNVNTGQLLKYLYEKKVLSEDERDTIRELLNPLNKSHRGTDPSSQAIPWIESKWQLTKTRLEQLISDLPNNGVATNVPDPIDGH